MPTSPTVRRPFVIASVMAAMFMIAIEATIVSTAMPQIAGQLGDLHLYSWVFAAFLLTQTATTVVFGKLADLFGRKPVLLAGIAIFLVGSLLCGFAWSMPSLILFRLIQGVGAGAIQPVTMTVVGDLYTAPRARQGAGLARQRLGHLVGRGAAGGRAHHPACELGLDLLDQPADRPRRVLRVRPLPARGAHAAQRAASTWPAPRCSPSRSPP